ncbi:MAG: hypothetical protein J6A90_07310 [Clostridia bacterium]|jgi:hypothetical protein|nr:hypothetical protein [Clostridia bacterium]
MAKYIKKKCTVDTCPTIKNKIGASDKKTGMRKNKQNTEQLITLKRNNCL